ncbi:MAG: hypothetical protein KDD52_05725 [Bdellovibrionales bacterium]|nr:hypothetical protein [Bdellovibrionales bacterium]
MTGASTIGTVIICMGCRVKGAIQTRLDGSRFVIVLRETLEFGEIPEQKTEAYSKANNM